MSLMFKIIYVTSWQQPYKKYYGINWLENERCQWRRVGGGEREAAFAPFLGQTALFMKISDQTAIFNFQAKVSSLF